MCCAPVNHKGQPGRNARVVSLFSLARVAYRRPRSGRTPRTREIRDGDGGEEGRRERAGLLGRAVRRGELFRDYQRSGVERRSNAVHSAADCAALEDRATVERRPNAVYSTADCAALPPSLRSYGAPREDRATVTRTPDMALLYGSCVRHLPGIIGPMGRMGATRGFLPLFLPIAAFGRHPYMNG